MGGNGLRLAMLMIGVHPLSSPPTTISIDCYWYCKKLEPEISDKEKKLQMLQERMGNTLNETGVYYMHVAKTLDYKKSEGQACIVKTLVFTPIE